MTPSGKYLPARIWPVVAFCCVFFLLTGCAPLASQPADSAPCPVSEKHIYSGDTYPELQDKMARETITKIHDFTLQNVNDPGKIAIAKREALKLLENQTKRWSDPQYISLEGEPHVRAIVTFLSPGLVRAVVLNQWLNKLNSAAPANLELDTNNSLKEFDDKNEFAFILLVQSEAQPVKSITIRPQDIRLHNTTGLEAKSAQSDDFLNIPLISSEAKHAGFFFYMTGLSSGQTCAALLDSNRDTSLVLRVDGVTVGEKKSDNPVVWRIYFPPLSKINPPSFSVDLSNPSAGEEYYESPTKDAPAPTSFDPASDSIYWRDVGRFIWWKMTMDTQ